MISSLTKGALGNGEVLRVAASTRRVLLPHNSCSFFPSSHKVIQEQEKQQMWLQPLQVSPFFSFSYHTNSASMDIPAAQIPSKERGS